MMLTSLYILFLPFSACAGLVIGVGVVITGGNGVVLVVESQEKKGGSGRIMS